MTIVKNYKTNHATPNDYAVFTTKDGDIGIVNRYTNEISSTEKHTGDKWDTEKAVAIGLLKLYGIPFSVVAALSKEVEDSFRTKKLNYYGKMVVSDKDKDIK